MQWGARFKPSSGCLTTSAPKKVPSPVSSGGFRMHRFSPDRSRPYGALPFVALLEGKSFYSDRQPYPRRHRRQMSFSSDCFGSGKSIIFNADGVYGRHMWQRHLVPFWRPKGSAAAVPRLDRISRPFCRFAFLCAAGRLESRRRLRGC